MIRSLSLSILLLDTDTKWPQDFPQKHQYVTQIASQDEGMPILEDLTVCRLTCPTPADVELATLLGEMGAVGVSDSFDPPLFVSFQFLGGIAAHREAWQSLRNQR